MRALILSWEYPPIVEGGLGRHVRKLAEGLAEAGVEVHVLTRGAREHAGYEERDGVHVHRVREPPFPRDDLDRFVDWVLAMNDHMRTAGAELVERLRPDLVHGHDWLVAKACEALARDSDVPYLTTIHATEFGRHQGWVGKHPQSFIHRVEARMAKRAAGVIVCSDSMRREVVDVFGLAADHVTVIPNGVDRDDVAGAGDPATLRARFARPDEQLVLLIGRLVHEKGFQDALDALPDVIERVGAVRFLVAGSGTHEAELKRQATRLGLDAHGTFLGWVGDDALRSLYAIGDLCVVPSRYEPFGIVALEAMAAGCPCLVADTGGLREIVEPDVGLRFRHGDPRSLGRAMERLLTDGPLRDRLVAEADAHVGRFDWGEIAAATAEVYARLVPAPAQA